MRRICSAHRQEPGRPPTAGQAVLEVHHARLEHAHRNWHLGAIMVLITQAWIGVLFGLSRRLIGLSAPIPPELIYWLLLGAINCSTRFSLEAYSEI